LGVIYQGIGDASSARRLLEKASDLFANLEGKQSNEWLATQYELTLVTMNQEKFDFAANMLQEIISTLENNATSNIRLLFKTQYLLALNLNYLGKATESKQLFEYVYEQQKNKLGKHDMDTLVTQRELAVSLLQSGEIKSAADSLLETMQATIKAWGEDHPQSLVTQSAYASAQEALGQKAQAEELLVRVIERSKFVNGEQSPSTVKYKLQLAVNQANQSKWERTTGMLEELIPQLKLHFGPFGFDTLGAIQGLGACFVMQKRYDKAESILLDCLADCRRGLGERHPNTLIIVENIVSLYESKNDIIRQCVYLNYLRMLNGKN
jgi:tetratricopeptide (TPR) repeat protein